MMWVALAVLVAVALLIKYGVTVRVVVAPLTISTPDAAPALTTFAASWWEEAKRPLALPTNSAQPVSDRAQMDEVIAKGVQAGKEELRQLYAAKGQARTDAELEAEAMDLLRMTMDLPDNEDF